MTFNQLTVIILTDDLKSTKQNREVIRLTDSEALKKLINSKGLKLKYVAEYLGLSSYGFALKLDNKQEFKTSEVAALCKLLNIKDLRIKEALFFKQRDDLKSTAN